MTVLLAATMLVLSLAEGPALAAPSAGPPLGIDVSYPQCGKSLPSGQAFAIVGVNGGRATRTNPCLAAELAWAARSTGATAQDSVQLYVNTGNPAGGAGGPWPRAGTTPRGTCDGSNSRACAYQYGWDRARDDATIRGVRHPEQYVWWLDVELANKWDYTSGGGTRNAAVLEGMTDYFRSIGVRGVGLYSSLPMWRRIIGNGVDSVSSLNGLPNWRPIVARTVAAAQAACGQAPMTAGSTIVMTQFTTDLDYDYSCR